MKSYLYVFVSLVIILGSCEADMEVEKKVRLDYYIETFRFSDRETFIPDRKVEYQYDSFGKLARTTTYQYNKDTQGMEQESYLAFFYSDTKVERIDGYLSAATDTYVTYAYYYLPNDNLTRITETNRLTGINSEATFTSGDNGIIKVGYAYSNGGQFEYEFKTDGNNILSDKTTRDGQQCSDGVYTYDNHKSPFCNLGYTDYSLRNFSLNNKLTESVNYTGCAFPSLVADHYSYEYNDDGFPTAAFTYYKSGQQVAKSRKQFFYRSN